LVRKILDKKPNYRKEIAKNNLILAGGKEYLGMIAEAVGNGFNG